MYKGSSRERKWLTGDASGSGDAAFADGGLEDNFRKKAFWDKNRSHNHCFYGHCVLDRQISVIHATLPHTLAQSTRQTHPAPDENSKGPATAH